MFFGKYSYFLSLRVFDPPPSSEGGFDAYHVDQLLDKRDFEYLQTITGWYGIFPCHPAICAYTYF